MPKKRYLSGPSLRFARMAALQIDPTLGFSPLLAQHPQVALLRSPVDHYRALDFLKAKRDFGRDSGTSGRGETPNRPFLVATYVTYVT